MSKQDIVRRWETYLDTHEGYGTYENRMQEYAHAAIGLKQLGMASGDLIVDVGAGSCDLDRYLRDAGWHGRYRAVDGAVSGDDLNEWLPEHDADFFVCLETLEHLAQPRPGILVDAMKRHARKGVLVSTPNALTHDVLATDPTHVTPLTPNDLRAWGLTVHAVTFTPARGPDDTLFGTYWAGSR